MAKPEAGPKPAGGGGHSAEKAKKFVENALSATEIAAYNVLPVYEGASFLFSGKSLTAGSFYGLVIAFGYSFVKEMIQGVLGKLGGGGH